MNLTRHRTNLINFPYETHQEKNVHKKTVDNYFLEIWEKMIIKTNKN